MEIISVSNVESICEVEWIVRKDYTLKERSNYQLLNFPYE